MDYFILILIAVCIRLLLLTGVSPIFLRRISVRIRRPAVHRSFDAPGGTPAGDCCIEIPECSQWSEMKRTSGMKSPALGHHLSSSRFVLLVGIALMMVIRAPCVHSADSAVVLMYHHFGESTYPSTNFRMNQFRSQLE